MTRSAFTTFLAATVAACALAAVPAFAKDHGEGHGNGHGKGHGKHEKHEKHDRQERAERHGGRDVRPGAYFEDRDRDYARRYYVEHYGGKRCPPGLAKKGNGCMPPGQARKWAVGQPIPDGVTIYSVPQPVLYQLPPPPPGYRYGRVGPDIVLIRIGPNLVVDIMLNVFG